MSTKRTIQNPEDVFLIENVVYSAEAGGKYVIQMLPVPERTLTAGDNIIGLGKKVWLGTAGYTLKDSKGVASNLVVPASLAPVGSVVSTGLKHDTITVGADSFLIADDSAAKL